MTVLIATFGRSEKRRPAAIKYFLYAFHSLGLLLVRCLWLYAQTGPSTAEAGRSPAGHAISPNAAACGSPRSASSIAFSVRSPSSRCTDGLVDAIAEAPTAAVMVLGRQDRALLHPALLVCHLPRTVHRIAP